MQQHIGVKVPLVTARNDCVAVAQSDCVGVLVQLLVAAVNGTDVAI